MTTFVPVTVDPELAKKLRAAARKINTGQQERDRLVVQALDEGGSLREVAALVGLTGPGVLKIRRRLAVTQLSDAPEDP